MSRFDLDFPMGCFAVVAVVLGITSAFYFGSVDNNQKYYASMDKCIAAGGSFIPMRGSEAVCFMGNKQ